MSNLILSIPVLYLAVYWLGAFFIVYHLVKYGITSWPKKIATVFLAGSILLSLINFMLFAQIDWQKIFGSNKMTQNAPLQNNKINTK